MLQRLQRVVSSEVTQHTQQLFMKKYRDMVAVEFSKQIGEVNLARLLSLQQGVGTAWMDVLPTKDT